MLEVLTNPNKFFEARMKGEVSLRIPVLIVLISGIISGIFTFLLMSIAAEIMRKTLPSFSFWVDSISQLISYV